MKKECYFTNQSIRQQAAEIYQYVTEIVPDKNRLYQPQQSALLVLDMQEYFLSPESHAYVPSSQAIVAGIIQLISEYVRYSRPIIFTQHVNTIGDAGMMSIWWKDTLTAGNRFHRLIPEIEVGKGILIQKSQYDAFYQTRLDEILHEAGITQVVICGVMTHLCCETTARSAFTRGFEVFFPIDGTATYNLEFHRASAINVAHGFGCVVLMRDILEAIQGGHEK